MTVTLGKLIDNYLIKFDIFIINIIFIKLLFFKTDQMLVNGREKLVKDNKGLRGKLQTREGNHIDTMFVDRRARY